MKGAILSALGMSGVLAACGTQSPEEIIEKSLQAYEEVESFSATGEQTIHIEDE